MLKLTKALKGWLTANCDVEADANDGEFREAAGTAMAEGDLTAEKFMKLTAEPEEKEANEFAKRFESIADGLDRVVKLLETKPKEDETVEEKTVEEAKEKEAKEAAEKAAAKKTGTKDQPSAMAKMIGNMGGTPVEMEGKYIDVRVKEAADSYTDTKSTPIYPDRTKSGRPHPMAGQPLRDFAEKGQVMQGESDRDKAVAGAFCKFLIASGQRGGSKTFGFQSLPHHDRELLLYAMDNMDWGGSSDGGDMADICHRRLLPREKQALIDDAVSGGFEAAPIVFDDMVIQTPLLHGELFPLVNTIPLDRGRRIEGVATGTVTGAWGGIDDTAVALFNTAVYVSAFDTTIFRWEGSIRIGLDFLSDTPIDFGAHVTTQYGERLLEDLDDVIAIGNGATQPTGITVHAGTTAVAFGGATTLGNYEGLRFGVPKVEHKANVKNSAVFCGTETSYMRARAIPVGAGDARRLGGMNYDSYNWMERPYKINESLANTQIFYAILARYRMYRRRGLVIRTSTEGDTLIRRNEMLIVAMARYGGQLERGAVAAVTATAPA